MHRHLRTIAVPFALLAASIAFGAGEDAQKQGIEKDIEARLELDTPMFVPEAASCADVKTCRKSCTAAVWDIDGGSARWQGARDCEEMGDMWADGRAKKGKPYPDAGATGWDISCQMGNTRACDKAAEYFEAHPGDAGADGWAEGVRKAFVIRATACLQDHEPACAEASRMVEQHQLPFDAEVLGVWGHVPACDDAGDAESCAWLEKHPEAATRYRAERAAKGKVTLPKQSERVIDLTLDTSTLRTTHRPVYTAYPVMEAGPEIVAITGYQYFYQCHEVWVRSDAAPETAAAVVIDDAKRRHGKDIPADLIGYDEHNPRVGLDYTPCLGRTRKLLAP